MDDVKIADRDFSRILERFKKLATDLDKNADDIEKLNEPDTDEETKGYIFSHRCCAEFIREAIERGDDENQEPK